MIYLVWPEKKTVSNEWIETQFADAVENREIAPGRINSKTVIEKARALDDAGLITLGNKKEENVMPKNLKPTDEEVLEAAEAIARKLRAIIADEIASDRPTTNGVIMLAVNAFHARVIMDVMRESTDRNAIAKRAMDSAGHFVSMVTDLIRDKFDK